MQSYEVINGPLADAAVWRGALLWALSLYVPLSAPLSRLEASLESSSIPETWRQGVLILSPCGNVAQPLIDGAIDVDQFLAPLSQILV